MIKIEDNKPIIKAYTPNSNKYDTKIDIYTSDPKGPHDSIHIAVDSDTKTAPSIVETIKKGDYDRAYSKYKTIVLTLEDQFLSLEEENIKRKVLEQLVIVKNCLNVKYIPTNESKDVKILDLNKGDTIYTVSYRSNYALTFFAID